MIAKTKFAIASEILKKAEEKGVAVEYLHFCYGILQTSATKRQLDLMSDHVNETKHHKELVACPACGNVFEKNPVVSGEEVNAKFEAEQAAEQDRLRGEAEAQAEAEAREQEGRAREEEEKWYQETYPDREPEGEIEE